MTKNILPLILLMPCALHGQVFFKNVVVNEITISKICYINVPFDKNNPQIISKRTRDENLIYEWDFRFNVFYDASCKCSRKINRIDSLQICVLLHELSITKKTPSASELRIDRKKIDRTKHKCFKNNYSEEDELTFFEKNAAYTDFDSIMSCRFRDFDSNSIVINTAHYSYSDEFCIIVNAEECQYTFIIRNHPMPLTPIVCHEEFFDLNNPSKSRVHRMYSIVNFSIQEKLSHYYQRNFKKLFKLIQKELCLLYKSDLERILDGYYDCGLYFWR